MIMNNYLKRENKSRLKKDFKAQKEKT